MMLLFDITTFCLSTVYYVNCLSCLLLFVIYICYKTF